MRVLPAAFAPLNYSFKSGVSSMSEDFVQTYSNEQQKRAQNLANTAIEADIGLLTVALINKASIFRKKANNSKALLMARIAVDLENKIKFHPDINEIVKEYNNGVKGALAFWSKGDTSKAYKDTFGRTYKSIYTDGNNLTHSLVIENTEGDVKERAEVNLNYQDDTVEFKFLNYKLDNNHKNTCIYANLKTNKVVSVSIANDWMNIPVSYSFKDGKPYMASYHTTDGKALAFFDSNTRVQKVFYQEYDKSFGAMELGKPEMFIKDANGDFLSLSLV